MYCGCMLAYPEHATTIHLNYKLACKPVSPPYMPVYAIRRVEPRSGPCYRVSANRSW